MAKTWKERQNEEAAVLHMEIDYHLMSLHEAMESENTEEIDNQKKILADKHRNLDRLNRSFRSRRI